MSKSVLITGCSDGGLGAELAIAFHKAGWRVIATARNPKKMAGLISQGIETISLDVLSLESTKKAVEETSTLLGGKLDMLINNAGAGYSMPILDIDIEELRKTFELNVYSLITITQEFLPLLRKSSSGTIVNNTSIASVIGPPIQGAYNASKAAAAMLTMNLRLELEAFGIKVVELKTGAVKTNFFANVVGSGNAHLPENSIYLPAKDVIEEKMHGEVFMKDAPTAASWAKEVVRDLSKTSPPVQVWRGASATFAKFITIFPLHYFDRQVKQLMGLDILAKRLAKTGSK